MATFPVGREDALTIPFNHVFLFYGEVCQSKITLELSR